MKLRDWVNEDIFLILFVNWILADTYYFSLFFEFIVAILAFANWENDNDFFYYNIISFTLFTIFYIAKLFILPIFYSYMYKNSKNPIVIKFIDYLKNNFFVKISVALLTLLPIYLRFNGYKNGDGAILPIPFNLSILLFSSITCYLVLYLWWWIEDIIKKHKKLKT